MTLQEAKDQAAREAGYISFRLAVTSSATDVLIYITNRALQIYGQSQWNAAIDAAARKVYWIELEVNRQIAESIIELKKP